MIKVIFNRAVAGSLIPLTPDMVDNSSVIDGLSKTEPTGVQVVMVDESIIDARILYSHKECSYHIDFGKYTTIGKGACIRIQGFAKPDDCYDGCAKKKSKADRRY